MSLSLASSIRYLKGIGPKRAQMLERNGIREIEDLLFYFPYKYQNRTRSIPISQVEIGTMATVKCEVVFVKSRPSFKRRFQVFEITVADDTGRLNVVWFNQSYLRKYFVVGARVVLYGKVDLYKDRIQMVSPEFEFIEDDAEADEDYRIVPFYSLPEGFSQRVYRRNLQKLLDKFIPQLVEVLPFDIRTRHALVNIAQSLRNIHFPKDEEARLKAYNRLSFEEFFIYQLPLILRKLKRKQKKGISFKIHDVFLEAFIKSLPFVLTDSQAEVISEIRADMSRGEPMQRLLQGDVGSGKTVVAVYAALIAVSNDCQTAFMVPTEILAGQHFEKLKTMFSTFSPQATVHSPQKKIKIGLLTSSLTKAKKDKTLKDIASGKVDIVIGTHALIQENVKFKKLGLIVIDEQHKFGVSQRTLLSKKAVNPDIIIMTATPIPRTLSMTLFGDLDISVIKQMPKGRGKIATTLMDPSKSQEVYEFMKCQIQEGRQVYIVYPLIEESPKLQLNSAKEMYKNFSENIFKDYRVGLVHGRLPRDKQASVMNKFRKHELDILVATTVLEVGIDVPNAAVMLIENADRFGLSQLHQMRGRIGRGSYPSFCFLVSDAKNDDAVNRLNAFVKVIDGFEIAEEDLKLRGPGEFFGERQHGLTDLKIADPVKQMHILKAAREEATRFLNDDPTLEKRQNQEVRRQLYKRFPEFEKFVMTG